MTATRTPVDTLREAARLMRERAEALPTDEGWYVDNDEVWRLNDPDGMSADGITGPFPVWAMGYAVHIASWHPAVALAVANWLDADASVLERFGIDPEPAKALAVARAYLGEQL